MIAVTMDIDGYPTDDFLGEISKYTGSWNNLMEQLAPVFRQHGRCEYGNEPGLWIVATGGWSGLESVIRAMQENRLFWATTWRTHKVGGYYEFATRPAEKTDRKEIK